MENRKIPPCSPPVKTSELQWSNMVISKSEDKCTYAFTITNFSLLKRECGVPIFSPRFTFEKNKNVKWRLKIYPAGENRDLKDFMAVYLVYTSIEPTTIKASFSFALLNSKSQENIKYESHCACLFDSKTPDVNHRGLSKYIKMDEILSNKEKFLPNDKLSIICSVVSANSSTSMYSGQLKVPKIEGTQIMLNRYEKLYSNSEFKDLTLIVGNKKISAHKCVLAAHSPVFACMFKHDMTEKKENSITIPDSTYEVVKEMVRFIYTGKVENLSNLAYELIFVAEKYAIDELKSLCEQSMCDHLNVHNVSNILVFADMYNSKELKEAAMKFIIMHKNEIIGTPDYEDVVRRHPMLILETFSLTKPTSNYKNEEPCAKKARID